MARKKPSEGPPKTPIESTRVARSVPPQNTLAAIERQVSQLTAAAKGAGTLDRLASSADSLHAAADTVGIGLLQKQLDYQDALSSSRLGLGLDKIGGGIEALGNVGAFGALGKDHLAGVDVAAKDAAFGAMGKYTDALDVAAKDAAFGAMGKYTDALDAATKAGMFGGLSGVDAIAMAGQALDPATRISGLIDQMDSIGREAAESFERSAMLQEAMTPPTYERETLYLGPPAEVVAMQDVETEVHELNASMAARLDTMIEINKEQARILGNYVELFSTEQRATAVRQEASERLVRREIWIAIGFGVVSTLLALLGIWAQVARG
jgi:hypothetical protein